MEDGQLLDMLEKPLQTSRGPREYRSSTEGGRTGRKGGRRSSKGRSSGRARGRNVTIRECATWICERLDEPKYYLMCQVVAVIGYNKSKKLLDKVRQTQVRFACRDGRGPCGRIAILRGTPKGRVCPRC